ncbi:iron-containing alcohol dehydrogenase [Metallumcola ferriviriculae]|uniref:Iron-containing alcohol dehydrogenase n=1 Tax=Metallumcola ferriviriculae TaxID=3039180 RepID=A0AAU0URJ6_9FIRM|nr:iron-containing alcohol dehydrogenase [Desulfitibacteraceae bacterium MK1]
MTISFFKNPTEIIYGQGSIVELGDICSGLGSAKVLIVTDAGVVNAGLLEKVKKPLEEKGIAIQIFSDVEPNPSLETVNKGLAKQKDFGAEVIVAVGGGSPIDVAKGIGILATNGGNLLDYEGANKVSKPALPIVAIPTTAGTGSEVTIFAVITDRTRKYKLTVASPNCACKVALLDPLLTVSMPRQLTASTGMDALVHAIESYTSLMAYPISEALALEAIKLISGNLRQAVYNGNNLEARDKMLMGSLLAGMAFNNTRLGNGHAMSHPLGGFFDIPHGIANSILIPHVMEFNLFGSPEKFLKIAEAMGEPMANLTQMDAAYRAVIGVKRLIADVGIPNALSEVAVTEDAFEPMAQDAMKSGNIQVNPRETKLDDVINIFKRAY